MGTPHALVIGAGIGGLTAAIALRRAGCTVEVHERADQLRPVGAGISVQPNAVLALRHLGVGDAVERAGRALRPASLSRADGRALSAITAEAADAMVGAVGAPVIGIHRATLQEILVRHLGAEHLHLGRTVAGYDLGDGGVRARFTDGSAREADLLIGADGIRSACRRQLLADGEPTYSGYFCWRGIAPSPGALGDEWAGVVWGKGTRFGGCCIDGGRFYWFAIVNGPAGGADPPGQVRATVLERFAGYSQPIRDTIAATPEDAILRSDIADRPTVTTWGQGRLTLLGDAAHPMTPNLAQGACQAIEDALVLGLELARDREVDAALRAYEQKRQPRANKVVVAARRMGAVGQWSNSLAVWLRNGMVRLTPTSMVERKIIDGWKLPYGGF